MNARDLYTKYDCNGDYIYFTDEACTNAYTGHIEDYDNGYLWREADVVDGFMNGIYKEYFENSMQPAQIVHCEHNLQFGLNVEFYESGKVHYTSLVISNDYFDCLEFDENGSVIKKEIWPDSHFQFWIMKNDDKKIKRLRMLFDLEKISEEIRRDGKHFDYEKYFKDERINHLDDIVITKPKMPPVINSDELTIKEIWKDYFVYFYDKEGTELYDGHVMHYKNNLLYLDTDIVNGNREGIYKEFYDSTKLKIISYYKNGTTHDLYIEFYENGNVHKMGLAIYNDFFDLYEYDETGTLKSKKIWPDSNSDFKEVQNELRNDKETIGLLRKKFNLEKINKKIQRDGKNFDYEKYFVKKNHFGKSKH